MRWQKTNIGQYDNKMRLSILHINCRSINENFDNLRHLIHQTPFQIPIIAVTETWTTKLTENNFSLPGYNFIAKSRESNAYGGVGIYVSDNLNFRLRDDLNFDVMNLFEVFLLSYCPVIL